MLSRTNTVLLVALVFATSAAAWEHSSAQSQGRKLLQAAFCPDGCEDGFCQQASTSGSLKCAKCKGNLLVDKATGFCACPRGKYTTGEARCIDCPKGSYCIGGIYSTARPPVNEPCPQSMTTLGLRAPSARSCVNMPGYSYDITSAGTPSATLCPLNTYGPGMKKQRACVPCPTGFTTNGLTGRTSAMTCVVPAGYYLKGPGQAAPCPVSEWKAGVGPDGSCTKCSAGVTTEAEGATSKRECKIVTKGYYASSFDTDGAVNGTTICPQGSYCPGGNQTQTATSGRRLAQTSSTGIIACPNGQWTMMPGASVINECLTPPGYYTDTTLGITARCPDHHYRADWLPVAPSCTPCGVGVKADSNDRVTKYHPNGTEEELPITSSSVDCYIQPGQALLYETLTKTWRAKDCTLNSYGVTNTTYGLTPAPCRDCPTGTVANRNLSTSAPFYTANADGTGGFTDEMACVTRPGFGMNGRGAQRCDQGYYNPGNNYETCKACGFGFTTTAAGAGITVADCITDKGYGRTGGKMGECPIGTYNDALVANASTACKACPTGRTTPKAGSDDISDCQLCSAGYGGLNCGTLCGGAGLNATYGTPGRALVDGQATECLPCSANGQTATYSFSYDMQNQLFTPRTVSRIGAASPIECLSEYSQINDGSYYLPISATEDPSGNTVFKVETVPTFQACITECDNRQCQLVTYDYNNGDCFVRVPLAPKYEGAPWLALKVLPSGYVGTSPWSVTEDESGKLKPKALSSGMYAFYQEHLAEAVGIQVLPSAVSGVERSTFTSVKDCLTACDDAGDKCSGITVLSTVAPNEIGATCMFVTANTEPGIFKRSMIRADLNRLIFPSSFLCPSGYTSDANGITPCTPFSTPVVVLLFMRAQGTCSASLIASVRAGLLAFLQDPTSAFGVYAPDVIVNVGCIDVPTGQRRLLQGDQADLTSIITYPGTASGAQNLVAACNTGECLSKVTNAPEIRVTSATVQEGTADPGEASIAVEAVPYVAGEPYYFKVTYKIGDRPDKAAVVLTSDPEEAMYCWTTEAGLGVTQFTCNPKAKLSAVSIIANGGNTKTIPPSRVTASVVVYNTTCLKGSIADDDICEGCAIGTYAPADATECTECSEGFTTLRMNSFAVEQCNRCIPGRQGTGCTPCPLGMVSAGGAASASLTCTACPTGQNTTLEGQSTCDLCMAGYAGSSCTACPIGAYAEGAAKGTENCTTCDVGYTTTGTAKGSEEDCDVCSAGYGGEDTCELCDFGFYAAGGTADECTACPSGQTTPTNGSTSEAACTQCQPGFGGPSCTECLAGTWSAGGARASVVCTPCATGVTTANNGSTSADACAVLLPGRHAATIVDGRITSAPVCPVGYYCPGGTPVGPFNATEFAADNSIGACEGNTISSAGAISADQCLCKPGFGGESCTECEIGFWHGGGSKANCTECTNNSTTTATGGTSPLSCTVCKTGFGLANSQCTLCPAGQYSDGTTACTNCPAGSKSDAAGSSSCTNCTVGQESAEGATACTDCGAGKINPTAGNTCTFCAAGEQPDGEKTECVDCGAGTYRTTDAASDCTPCGLGKYVAEGAGVDAAACVACLEGKTTTNPSGAADATACTVCLPGYGGANCDECGAGSFSPGGDSATVTCTLCPAGTWSAAARATSATTCTECEAGTYSETEGATDATTCTECPPERSVSSPGSNADEDCTAE